MTKTAISLPPNMQQVRLHVRGLRLVSLNFLLLASLGGWAGVTLAASSLINSEVPQSASQHSHTLPSPMSQGRLSQSVQSEMFQQAIADDLSQRPLAARKLYDALEDSEMAGEIAVPSAVNLAALARFEEAKSAFAVIAQSANPRESNYALLWQLWLTARMHTGKTPPLKKQLSEIAAEVNLGVPYQQAIVDLYAGKGHAEAIFSAIDTMPDLSEADKQNFITEATFFTEGYLRYVSQDRMAALQLFKRYQHQLYIFSLERPLINESIAELETAKGS
ncbi:hypothetical protein [Serratia fonticola]|uniref:hypothetical protein n=1 Tax=Serratia fonticola TaxID=47917 RepID=UPI0027F930A2|nr:hypothetical protein [Serratia fonticola]MDQ7212040.1 hypothetical protein [Serratia fonticola]HBE9082905.1 hypothetical protein [Serratia fonticola]HBE9093394.1 hypothetical protein [Serratia fonticola]HBE9155757.1 hypothetical protein [Serratia fonticola]